MKAITITVAFLAAVFSAGAAAGQHIPPGMEQRVLDLLKPYGVDAPADEVLPGILIDKVGIDKQQISIVLKSSAGTAVLTLTPATEGASADVNTPGFAITFDEGARSTDFNPAATAVVAAIRNNDSGDFWNALPAPADLTPPAPPPSAGGGFAVTDFIGELLLLVMLVLLGFTARYFISSISGQPVFFWLGLVACVILGASYRFFVVPSPPEQPKQPDVVCSSSLHCNDFNDCTEDLCVDQMCEFNWAPPAGVACCHTDADCPALEDPCLESFCSPSNHLCADRTKTECNVGPYSGQSRPPLDSSVGWLYSVPAKFTGNTSELAAHANVVLSTLSILLLGLLLVAWGAPAGMALSASFLLAVYPAGLAAAPTVTMAGLLGALLLLLLWVWALLARTSKLTGKHRLALTGLAALLIFLLTTARSEAIFLLLPMIAALLPERGLARLWPAQIVSVGGAALAGLALRHLMIPWQQIVESIPSLPAVDAWSNFLANADILFLQGVAVPVFVLVLVCAGIPVLLKENRSLLWMMLLLVPAVLGPVLFLELNPYQLVRLTGVPGLSFVVLAGAGLWRLARLKARFAWLAVAILVAYLAFFPLAHVQDIQDLAKTPSVTSHFYQI